MFRSSAAIVESWRSAAWEHLIVPEHDSEAPSVHDGKDEVAKLFARSTKPSPARALTLLIQRPVSKCRRSLCGPPITKFTVPISQMTLDARFTCSPKTNRAIATASANALKSGLHSLKLEFFVLLESMSV
jgi:hypothetical protein